MKRFGFPSTRRIRSELDFARIYGLRQRASNRHLLIFAAANDLGFSRIGLSVSKKHGNAIKRARLKRLLREAFRLTQHELPAGLDLILIPQQKTGATLRDYQQSLQYLCEKLNRRIANEAKR